MVCLKLNMGSMGISFWLREFHLVSTRSFERDHNTADFSSFDPGHRQNSFHLSRAEDVFFKGYRVVPLRRRPYLGVARRFYRTPADCMGPSMGCIGAIFKIFRSGLEFLRLLAWSMKHRRASQK